MQVGKICGFLISDLFYSQIIIFIILKKVFRSPYDDGAGTGSESFALKRATDLSFLSWLVK